MIMKRFLFGLLAFLLFGCAPQQNEPPAPSADAAMPKLASLPDLGRPLN